jgi:hypothetical protein
MIIRTRNTLSETAPKTFLSNAEVAGTTIFRIKNSNGFANGWGIQVGETGEEQTEVLVLSGAPSGTAGTTTAASTYEHSADTPIYAIKYDQIVFERSTAGTAGTASPLTNGTVTIQADQEYTQFDDTTGSTSYAYRTYFRSSGLAANSTESDWITSAGFSFYSLARLRERVKRKLWSASYIKEDPIIDDWINEWKDEMTNAVISLNENYALGTVDVAFGTNGLGTVTTADFKDVRRVWVTYDGVNTFQSTKMDINDFYPTQIFSTAHPYHYYQGDTVIGVKPSDTAGTASLVFYRFGTTMVNDTDNLPQPFRSYTKSFVDYGLAQAYYLDGKETLGDRFMNQASAGKANFVSEMSPRDQSGPTYIDTVEPLSGADGLDDFWF